MEATTDNKKQEQIISLANALRAEKAKFPNHLLNNYVIHTFTDSVGLRDKKTGEMIKIYF